MEDDLFAPIAVIPNINQQLMDDAVTNNPSFDRGFVWMAISQKYRDQVNQRWSVARQYCEPNFVSEFRDKDKFNGRYWELNLRYLYARQLIRIPGSGEPDLIANNYVAECVVPAASDVPDLVFDGLLYQYPTDEIARRVTSALVIKLAQLNTRRARAPGRIDYTSTPYIIALGLPQREFRSAMHMNGMDIIEAVLMGAGPLQLTIGAGGGTGTVGVSSQGTMMTRNGTEFDIAYFQRDEWKDVSAVMWSSEWLPEHGDMKLLLNPNANIPLNPAHISPTPKIITYTRTATGYTRDQPVS
jgi:hypothetical protein